MTDSIVQLVSALPRELAVIIIGFLPVGELRAAIPVGYFAYRMPIWEAFVLAQIGNVLPVFAAYALCGWWVRLVERRKGLLHRITDRVLKRAHAKVHGDVAKWGPIALIIFVGIPLPMTGAWTGALGAYLLNIPFRKAVLYIFLGNLISGAIVSALIMSGSRIFG